MRDIVIWLGGSVICLAAIPLLLWLAYHFTGIGGMVVSIITAVIMTPIFLKLAKMGGWL